MGQRVIPVAVTAEYIGGDGVTLGAAGSHNSVLIEYDFRSAGPQWDDISGRYVLWTNPQGNSTNRINLGVSEKVAGYEGVYQAAPPADAMCVPGWAEMVVVGFTLDGDKEVTKIKTEPSRFRVLPGSSRAADNEGVAPTVADQLQAEIEAVEAELDGKKVNKPVSPYDGNGLAGQFLTSLGGGKTRWVDSPLPTQEQVDEALEKHPEWTTTVRDGSISNAKLASDVKAMAHDEPYLFIPYVDAASDPNGNCFAFICNGHATLIDLGRYTAFDIISSQLHNRGVEEIDNIIITHWHGDHDGTWDGKDAGQKYDHWKEGFDLTKTVFYIPREIDTSRYDATAGYEAVQASFGEDHLIHELSNSTVFSWEGIDFSVRNQSDADYAYYDENLEPFDGTHRDLNPTSAIVYAEYGDKVFLDLGDITRPGQERCMAQGYIRQANFVSIPHHGVNGVCFPGVMEMIQPQAAYVANNFSGGMRFGIRGPMIQTAAMMGIIYENIFNRGGITVSLQGRGLSVSGHPTNTVGITGSVSRRSTQDGSLITSDSDAHRVYVDGTVSIHTYQDGTAAHPYKYMKNAVSRLKGYTEIHIIHSSPEEELDPVTINGSQGVVRVFGYGNKIGGLDLRNGAHVELDGIVTKSTYGIYAQDSFLRVDRSTIASQSRAGVIMRSTAYFSNITLSNSALSGDVNDSTVTISNISGTSNTGNLFNAVNRSSVSCGGSNTTGMTLVGYCRSDNRINAYQSVSDADDAPDGWVYLNMPGGVRTTNAPYDYCMVYTASALRYRTQIGVNMSGTPEMKVRKQTDTGVWSSWFTLALST